MDVIFLKNLKQLSLITVNYSDKYIKNHSDYFRSFIFQPGNYFNRALPDRTLHFFDLEVILIFYQCRKYD